MRFVWPILLLATLPLSRAQAASLTLWHAYRGAERTTIEALAEQYDSAHPDVDIVTRAVPYDGFVTKLEAAIPRGHGPDLFIAAHERLGGWAAQGLVAPRPREPTNPHPAFEGALAVGTAHYGLPLAFKCLALFYNRDLVSSPPRDTDALIALARDQRTQGRFGLAYSATEPYFHAPWLHGHGGALVGDDGIRLDRQGAAQSLQFVEDMLRDQLVPEESTSALVTQLFNDGQAAMAINGPWFLGEIDPSVNFGVVPLPIISETHQAAAPYLTVEAIQVSTQTRDPEHAWAFAEWLVAPEAARTRAIEGRQSVATLSVYDDPAVADDPILMAFRAQLDATVPLSNQSGMSATWEPMARAIRRVMRGAAAPDAALRQAQKEYEIITRPPPEPANPTGAIVAAALILLGLIGWFVRGVIRSGREIREWRFAYRWVLPAGVAMGVLVVVPFVVGAAVSLLAHRDGQWTYVGLAHFLDILFARDWPLQSALSFWFTLGVTIAWTVANVALHVTIGVGLAMLLRAPWLHLKGIYRVLLILPWAIPNYITALIWKGMFHRQFGAINGLLEAVGLPAVSWFSQFSTAFAANLITNTWLGFPFMMVVTLGALQAIPQDLEEAASIDGATGWQRFRHITWPLLGPALLPAIVLGSIWTFNMFNIIYLVSGGEPDGGTEILISEAYRWAFTRGHRYGYAAAYAVLIFGVLLVYSRATDRILTRKAT